MGSLQGSAQQFTIFYSGHVTVYDHVPAHKARAIMLLLSDLSDHRSAGNSSLTDCSMDSSMPTLQPRLSESGVTGCAKASYPPPRPPTPSTPTTDNTQITQFMKKQPIVIKRSQAELPFARKASLARFLDKRKDRVLEAMKVNEDIRACAEGDVEAFGSPCKRMKH